MGLRAEMVDRYRAMKNEAETQVKIALLGQPGAGKSSLINRLLGKKLFEVGVHTDTTVEAQEATFGQLIITDLPGYGTQRFPIDRWVEEFAPQDYDLYLFVFDGKLHDSDAELFSYLEEWCAERKHPYFVIRNKADQIWDDDRSYEELQADIRADVRGRLGNETLPVHFVSCRTGEGLKELSKEIFATQLDEVQTSKLKAYFMARSREDILEKKKICLQKLEFYAITGSVNAINPIPGLDISVDIGIFYKMMAEIRDVFNINEAELKRSSHYDMLAPVAEKVFKYATQEGIVMLVKKLAEKFLGKETMKYVPFVGQAASAAAGYMMLKYVGKEYIEDCSRLAEALLQDVAK